MIVCCHHHCGASAIDLFQQRHDALARCWVEVAGWLIGQHDERSINKCTRDRHTLLLSARQLLWKAIFLASKTN